MAQLDFKASEINARLAQVETNKNNISDLSQKVDEIDNDIYENEEVTEVVAADTASGLRNVNAGTGEFLSSSQANHYANEIELTGTETNIVASKTSNFSSNYGYAFLTADGTYVSGAKETGGELTIDPTEAIAAGAAILRITVLTAAATITITRVSSASKIDDLTEKLNAYPSIQSSSIGGASASASADTLTDGNSLELTNYPQGNNKGDCIQVSCDVTTFSSIRLDRGYNKTYGGRWITIDNTNVTLDGYNKETLMTSVVLAHGLTISTFLYVNVKINDEGVAQVTIKTLDGEFTHDFSEWTLETRGLIAVTSIGSSLTNCILSANNKYYKCPIWYFGASYEGLAENRIMGQIKSMGYYNFYANQWSGRSANELVADFKLALNFGTPRILVAILANITMDNESVYEAQFNKLVTLCKNEHIELIVRTHPNVKLNNYDTRNTFIRQAVTDNGLRLVDYYKAMHDDSKTWESGLADADNYDGYIDSTGNHPSVLGAQALAMRVLTDIPEIMGL